MCFIGNQRFPIKLFGEAKVFYVRTCAYIKLMSEANRFYRKPTVSYKIENYLTRPIKNKNTQNIIKW